MKYLPIMAMILLAACGEADAPPPATAQATAGEEQPRPGPQAQPGGFALFPGAVQLSRSSASQNGQSFTLQSLASDAPPQALVEHYRQQAEAAGIAVSLEVAQNGMHQIGGEAPSGLNFSLTASRQGNRTIATLAVGAPAP